MSNFVLTRAGRLGLKVLEASKTLRLEVTQEDVDSAVCKNSKCCAFSRAARRLPKVKAAYFFRTTAYIEYQKKVVRYLLPMGVQKEIVSFDRAKIVAPGEYWLNPADKAHTKLWLRHRDRERARGKKKTWKPKSRSGKRVSLLRTLREPAYIETEKKD